MMGPAAGPLIWLVGVAGMTLLALSVFAPKGSRQLRRVATVSVVATPILVGIVFYTVRQGVLSQTAAWIVVVLQFVFLGESAFVRWLFGRFRRDAEVSPSSPQSKAPPTR